jgi:hypothetical protein
MSHQLSGIVKLPNKIDYYIRTSLTTVLSNHRTAVCGNKILTLKLKHNSIRLLSGDNKIFQAKLITEIDRKRQKMNIL